MHLIIVSGMLGVGKTSVVMDLIDRLTEKGRRIAVIENDIGAKGVDADMLRNGGTEVRELKGGCICCTMKSGLIDTLRFLEANHSPETVLVEPTGIADPAYILNSVDGVSGLTVDRRTVIIVIDAERYDRMRRMFERPLRNQLQVADLVLLNKIDTQDGDGLDSMEGSVRSLGYEGPVLRVQADNGTNMERIPEVLRL